MLVGGKLYNEVAELGNKGGLRTVLLRSEDGDLRVYKEITRDTAEVYRKLCIKPHKNIVTVFGLKAVDEDKCGVFMEYFPSDTLEDRIVQMGKLTLQDTKEIMLQVCAAAQYFHSEGIIHRDLKPMNILIGKDGFVKVTDFGIARIYKKEKFCDTEILGTAGYAAPEQFGFFQTDEKADVYSIGVVLNKMLTGKMPTEVLYQGDIKVGGVIRRCICMSQQERCEIYDIAEALGSRDIRKPLHKHILRKIPGFRTGNKIHMTLAILNYVYMGGVFLITCIIKNRLIDFVIGIAGLCVMTLGMGYFVGGFGKMAYRLHMNRGIRKGLLVTAYVFVGCIIWAIGSCLMFW